MVCGKENDNEKNYELELYKLIVIPDEEDSDISYVDEFGWVSDTAFYVWISIVWLEEFVKRLNDIFGYSLFDEGGIEARIGGDYACINLKDIAAPYGVDLEEVFPKNQYRH